MPNKYVFGPVPSRRLGQSLGVSPIPEKTCNFNCIYCQLGRTNKMTNTKKSFFKIEDILKELKEYLNNNIHFDVISIVGEGEPTLYKDLGTLIDEIKKIVDKKIVVITNSALMSDEQVRENLYKADIVMPSIDAFDEESFRLINRPYGTIKFAEMVNGLIEFSKNFKGQLWLEIMLVKDFNDNENQLKQLKSIIDKINYERIYVNTPVRPPAEEYAKQVSNEIIENAKNLFSANSIENLTEGVFYCDEKDTLIAIKTLIRRHPMKESEIVNFIENRGEKSEIFMQKIYEDKDITFNIKNNEKTFRIKK